MFMYIYLKFYRQIAIEIPNLAIWLLIMIMATILAAILLYLLLTYEERLIESIEFLDVSERRKIGGMASIWICEHPRLQNKKIVVKFPQKNCDRIPQDTIDHRFDIEVTEHKRLQHKNIVQLLEHGQCRHPISKQKTRYLIQEFVDGCTIENIIKFDQRKRLNENIIFEIVAQILDALEYIHSQGVIHRDLSWGNIMVDITGKVYLIDFGNATTLGEDKTGRIRKKNPDKSLFRLGTPFFYPPYDFIDVYSYENMPNTAAKDFYALAILIYFMYGGPRPKHKEASKARTFVSDKLEQLNSIPREVNYVLLRCLEGKYSDVSEIRKDLPLRRHTLALMVKDIVHRDAPPDPSTAGGSAQGPTDLTTNQI